MRRQRRFEVEGKEDMGGVHSSCLLRSSPHSQRGDACQGAQDVRPGPAAARDCRRCGWGWKSEEGLWGKAVDSGKRGECADTTACRLQPQKGREVGRPQ